MQTTPRWGTRSPDLTGTADSVADVPLWIRNLAMDLDDHAKDDQGLFADRPISSPAQPGRYGRYYFATDTEQLFRDRGTGWDEVPIGVGQAASTGDYKYGVQAASHGLLPDGVHFAWLLCEGAEVEAYYTKLIALLNARGNPFGVGPGGRPKLPDFRSRVPVHASPSNGAGLSVRAIGAVGGEESHVLSIAEMPQHNHSGAYATTPTAFSLAGPGGVVYGVAATASGINYTGGNGAHNNMQPYLAGGSWFLKA